MGDLDAQKISQGGITPTFSNADSLGDTFPNDGKTYYHVKNDGAASIDVIFDSVEPCNQGFDHDLNISVPSGGEQIIGPFQTRRFNNTEDRIDVTYSDTTSVTVAAFRI